MVLKYFNQMYLYLNMVHQSKGKLVNDDNCL